MSAIRRPTPHEFRLPVVRPIPRPAGTLVRDARTW
jgi:hypothetical protein